ncbi:MAG: 50S ribosomal protein L6 [Gammaproteobacteria bacterium RIFCSPHIGHO2_12_FULL_45_9]|nr:MAG: 50S ribosomal protein L6 [Gammaproteobacteria bacterium RIFCSPHIGHO2_12_FULL_45_9]
MVSRVARNPISLPTGVELKEVQLDETNFVVVKGKKGELKCPVPPLVELHHGEKTVSFALVRDTREANALAGTLRALVSNMVKGVTDGFEIKLLLVGVGYRAKAQGKTLELALGFSHPVVLDVPEGLQAETPAQTEVVIRGIDCQRVAQFAANVRALRKPDAYKGKGVRYADEKIRLKEVKKK